MRRIRGEACVRAFARAVVCAWARPHPRQCVRGLDAADPRVAGSQAFISASAFNANIGAWNTASITVLSRVCFGPRAPAADALRSVFDAARPLCAAAPQVCACARGVRACCIRARSCVRGRARIRANVCEHLTPPIRASSARRRSTRRQSSTRTSARGTPPPSRRCPMYAPPFGPRASGGGRASVGLGRGAAVVRGGAADVRVRASVCVCM